MITSRILPGSSLVGCSGFIGSFIVVVVVPAVQWTAWLPDGAFSMASANAVTATTHVGDGGVFNMVGVGILTIF